MAMKEFTIFVLDDDKVFCSLLKRLAERDDFVYSVGDYKLGVTVFDNMEALDTAVEYIETTRPDLVLLDYFLGPEGCVTSLNILKKIIRCCASSTDIHIMSGMFKEDLRLILTEKVLYKMDMGVIQKPFGLEELISVIKKSINKKENVRHS